MSAMLKQAQIKTIKVMRSILQQSTIYGQQPSPWLSDEKYAYNNYNSYYNNHNAYNSF